MKHSIKFYTLFIPLYLITWGVLVMSPTISRAQAVKVDVTGDNGNYQLLRAGEPYRINGAGLPESGLESLAAHGGNSIRTWNTVDSSAELLDEAHKLGITVSLCLYTGSERHGFDYDDPVAVKRQLDEIRTKVLKFKDHPALLTWIIGNELNFDYTNPKVYDAVNDISKMIHELDENHPTTTTIAGFSESLLDTIHDRAPDLDFISIQAYGQLFNLPKFINETQYAKPFFITEWGAIGHWEVPKTSWGAPLEQDSSEKADTYLRGYKTIIKPLGDQVLGNYVFVWGQKQEKTPTWFGLFTETGEETEVIDVMHYIWTGSWPENRTPRIKSARLNGYEKHENIRLKSGDSYPISVNIEEPDDDLLRYQWEVKPETTATQVGGDFEAAISNLNKQVIDAGKKTTKLIAPEKTGAYRLFVYAYDGHGHAAHANIPFYVDD